MRVHQVLAFTLGASQDRTNSFDTERATCEQAGRVTDVLRIVTTDPESVDAVDEKMVNGLVAREDGHVVRTHPEPISPEP